MEEELRIVRKHHLYTHDVYQFSYAHDFDPDNCGPGSFWLEQSLYLCDSPWGMAALEPAISKVFSDFGWYGVTRVSLEQWDRVKALHLAEKPQDAPFFEGVRQWLETGNRGADYFWILGP